MSFWEYHYRPAAPRPVKDGIKTRSQRGRIGETWWSSRWIGVLESLGMGARLDRGRSYARRGQVMNLDIGRGMVSAQVQGTRRKPYDVTIGLKPLTESQWDRAISVMASKAIFAAKLLAGEMPQDIEDAFQEAGVSLFPANHRDLETDCSCPDWANPCKHIAAVYFLLAEEFDRDPFMVFRLRGKDKQDIIAALRELRSVPSEEAMQGDTSRLTDETAGMEFPSLESCLEDFWSWGDSMDSFRVEVAPDVVPEAVLKRLGTPSCWDSEEEFAALASAYYAAISRWAMEEGLR